MWSRCFATLTSRPGQDSTNEDLSAVFVRRSSKAAKAEVPQSGTEEEPK